MIEPERADAAAKAAFIEWYTQNYTEDGLDSETDGQREGAITWEAEDDSVKNKWRLIAVAGFEAYEGSRPGRPCSHPEYYSTGRCAEMNCSNYVNKHRPMSEWART